MVNNESNSGFGEKILMDRLIVRDDVSGIADGCYKFAKFLTVCRKYRYHSIYVFHIIAPDSWVWKKILSQTNIFNIFPSSVPYNTVAKILQSNCRQTTQRYVPVHSIWLSRVFVDLANTNERHCLTTDSSGRNKNGPGRYWTQAKDPDKQVCYFNQLRDDELYNVFISNRIKAGDFSNSIYFKINRVQGKVGTFYAEKTLKEDGAYHRFSKGKKEVENDDTRKLLSTLSEGIPSLENQLNLNFFQGDNIVPKKKNQKKICKNKIQ